MKKIVLIILTIALLASPLAALAEDLPVIDWNSRVPDTKATSKPRADMDDKSAFEDAVEKLRQNNRESAEEARQILQGITGNQSDLLAIYASALVDVYDENFDDAQIKLDVLAMHGDFGPLLNEYALPGLEVVQNYIEGRKLEAIGEYDEALDTYVLISFYDSAERMVAIMAQRKNRAYDDAQALFDAGEYARAAEAFAALKGYRDSAELAKRAAALVPTPKPIPVFKAGDIVVFGHYEQDNEISNGAEPIEWIVLNTDGHKALLLSKYGLEAKQYNKKQGNTTWEKCSLRKWLNQEFMNEAFTSEEQTGILLTDVDNSKSQGYKGYDTDGGNNTQDKVFLLSYSEAWTYFRRDDARMCAPTDYAVKQRAFTSLYDIVDGRATGCWWLRSPGTDQDTAAYVNYGGSLYGIFARTARVCVRPVFWADLESGIF